MLLASSACGGSAEPDPDTALQQMLDGTWAAYTGGIGWPSVGGLVLYVSTPGGNHFAFTGVENASPGIHFRVASNTKTFRAAAIMLLQQRGPLSVARSSPFTSEGTRGGESRLSPFSRR